MQNVLIEYGRLEEARNLFLCKRNEKCLVAKLANNFSGEKVAYAKKTLTFFLISSIFFQNQSFALDQASKRKTSSSYVTVALVPFAEKPSADLTLLIGRMEKELQKTHQVQVLDRKSTNEILTNYLFHVSEISKHSSQEQLITEARQKLLDNDLDAARKLLNESERRIQDEMKKGKSNDGLSQIYLLRAKIYKIRKEKDSAEQEYEKLLSLNPDFQLDPSLYTRWERDVLKTAKDAVLSRKSGIIKVVSDPEASEVFLNGFYRGISPLQIDHLPAGKHVIEVKTVNHDPFLQQVVVKEEEAITIKPFLVRNALASDHHEEIVRPSNYKTEAALSTLISNLGYHLGVSKVVLVTNKNEAGLSTVFYRLGDTSLGSVQTLHSVPLDPKKYDVSLASLVSKMKEEAKTDILKNPAQYANQTVGSLDLQQKRRKPVYKRPLFWVLVGTGAATAGVLGVILGGSASAAGSSGILVGL
ncbi:MAG: PEGA domain-containing protein [Deltaproteobacteria bacterium]|nr:MAG: PEGA domain-containing protein [Deltaproteobacteria bacterium]